MMIRLSTVSLGLVALLLAWRPAHAVDLSLVSDFGRPDIVEEKLGPQTAGRSLIGVLQAGDQNAVQIDQSGDMSNHVELWQEGARLSVSVTQGGGGGNLLRLSQTDADNQIDLNQWGVGNGLAAQQFGSGNRLSGSQFGEGNLAALVEHGGSDFSFTQQGRQNQLTVDLPAGTTMHVDQIGDNLNLVLQPN